MGLFSSLKSGLQAIVPGRELARGLGVTLSLPETTRLQEQTSRRQKELDDMILEEFKSARLSGDTQKIQRLRRIMEQSNSVNVLDEVLRDAPTTRQVLASAGELALFAGLGYKPYLKGGGFVSRGALRAAKPVVTKAVGLGAKALRTGKILGREAVIGGAFGALIEAQEKDATTEDIVKSAETWALLGPAFVAGGVVLGKGLGLVGKGISKVGGKVVSRLERVATGQTIGQGKTQLEKTLSYIGQKVPFRQRLARAALKPAEVARKFRTLALDRFHPLKRMEDKLFQVKGMPLNESEKIYRDVRILSDLADAKAEKMVSDYTKFLNKYNGATKTKAKAYLVQLDLIDRASAGQKVAGGQSLAQLKSGLKQLLKEIGPEDIRGVAEIRQKTRAYHINLLDDRVSAGLISKDARDAMVKAHPNYIPHNVIMDVDERLVRGLGGSLNVSRTDIMKAVGSVRNIDDPFVAMTQRTPIATRTIEKNKLLNNMVKAQEKFDVMPGSKRVFQTIKTPEGFRKVAVGFNYKADSGFDVISLFRKGTRETWQVPQDLAFAIKNMDTPVTSGFWNLLTAPQRLLKKSATRFNLSFALPNKLRDKQTAALVSQGFIDDLVRKYELRPTGVIDDVAKLTKAQLDDLYGTNGGFGTASIFREGESKAFKKLEKTGVVKKLEYANPLKMIETINETLEQSTRKKVFRQALEQGLDIKDAILVSRDAPIDFAKMGAWMRPVNQAVPFLNARVQGFANLAGAVTKNPEMFARMQLYTAVYPTMALYQNNRRFESYKNISQYYKNKYWIIMIGEEDSIDSYTGKPIKVPQFITLPKGEGQALVSGPLQHYLEKADGTDRRTVSQMLVDTLGSASPLEFQSFESSNWVGSAIGQLGPGVSIPVGIFSGKHPYFGTDIVPESRKDAPPELQFKRTTPEITKDIGKLAGISPAMIEFTIDSFGGLAQDMQDAVDMVYGVIRGNKLGGNSITETPIGALTQVPITRRFIRESTERGAEAEAQRELKKGLEVEIKGKRLNIYDQAEEIWTEMNKKDGKEERLNYLNSLGDELTPEVKKRLMQLKSYRNTVEVLKTTDSVELRARYILQRIDEMKLQNISLAERTNWLNELQRTGILSKKVKQRIAQLKAQ